MNEKPKYDNELSGRLWMQNSQNPSAPIAKFELTINGEVKKFCVWPEQLPKNGGNPFHRVQLDKPREAREYIAPAPKAPEPFDIQDDDIPF